MSACHALVPAAGFGARMGHQLPKQYMRLAGQPMIAHALHTLCRHPRIETVSVVLAPDDQIFPQFDWTVLQDKLRPLYCGGQSRAQSVLNGLKQAQLQENDWVLVHDAARPCLNQQHLDDLIMQLENHEVGGILASPVADTLKRAGAIQQIVQTENREQLWQAQTPQMFRAGLLTEALIQCSDVTDEASAIEFMGYQPLLVNSCASNFKVTYPQDFKLAELLLAAEEKDRI